MSNDQDTATEEYQHLIEANNEAAQIHLPTRKKKQKKQLAEDRRVAEARQKVQDAFAAYQNEPERGHQMTKQFEKEN